MAKYRLLVPHVISDVIYPRGTEIGDDTDVPFSGTPGTQMEGLDDEGRSKVNELHQRLYGRDAHWHTPEAEDARAEAALAAEEAEKQEPVKVYESRPASTDSPLPPEPPGPVPATPKESDDPRPENPNEDQYPKG